jgi:signal transduction histidine kinase
MKEVLETNRIDAAPGPAVLLVEDDAALGRLMTTLLAEAGYRSLTIADHDEIEAAILRFDPSCVLLDGELGPAGHARSWTDAAAIGRAHPDLPVVMFTADADAVAEERAGTSRRSLDAAFAGVVPKPFVIDEFLATLRSAIGAAAPNVDAAATVVAASTATAEQTKTDVWSAAVHDLTTPLATISGQMQLARKLMADDPVRGRAAVDIALQQLERMSRVIARLPDVLSLEASALSFEVVTFDICEAVGDAIKRRDHREATRMRFDRPKQGIDVRGDPDRIAQLLDDLLTNAVKYSPSATLIDIAVTSILGEAQVRVEDYGLGVAGEERDRMFTAYFRTLRMRALAAAGLAPDDGQPSDEDRGRLWLEDTTDSGSVFAFSLPLAD